MSDEMFKGLKFLLMMASLSFIVGTSFTLGVAIVCRCLGWAPVNFTLNSKVYERPADGDAA